MLLWSVMVGNTLRAKYLGNGLVRAKGKKGWFPSACELGSSLHREEKMKQVVMPSP